MVPSPLSLLPTAARSLPDCGVLDRLTPLFRPLKVQDLKVFKSIAGFLVDRIDSSRVSISEEGSGCGPRNPSRSPRRSLRRPLRRPFAERSAVARDRRASARRMRPLMTQKRPLVSPEAGGCGFVRRNFPELVCLPRRMSDEMTAPFKPRSWMETRIYFSKQNIELDDTCGNAGNANHLSIFLDSARKLRRKTIDTRSIDCDRLPTALPWEIPIATLLAWILPLGQALPYPESFFVPHISSCVHMLAILMDLSDAPKWSGH